MDKINWCKKQKDGIKLVEPNEQIGREYLKESEEDFKNIKNSTDKWKNITGYYACYNAFYELLQKIGIKCKIHDCTLESIQLFEELKEYETFLKEIKTERIDVQYHLKKPKKINENKIRNFKLKCEVIFNEITYDEIQEIRRKITTRKVSENS